ncbi:hypothetical protein ACHAXS_009689 [Conticribra weissflogii]
MADRSNDDDDDAPEVDYEADDQEEEETRGGGPSGPERPAAEFPLEIGPEAVGNERPDDTNDGNEKDEGTRTENDKVGSGAAAPPSGLRAGGDDPEKGAGDSETDEDSDGEVAGPRPPAAGAGDSETEDSSSEGEIDDDGDGPRSRDRRGRSRGTSRSSSGDRRHGGRGEGEAGNERDKLSSRSRDDRGGDSEVSARRLGEDAPPSRGYGNVPAANINKDGTTPTENRRVIKPCLEENIGVYIPPAKRRLLEEERNRARNEAKETSVVAYAAPPSTSSPTTPIHIQRQSWENLKRTINGTINRLSPQTIKPLIHSLFQNANLVRGRGILARSLLRASQASPQYSPTYAALMAVINTKLPECGELLLVRAILAFRRGYKTRDRNVVSSTLALLGHLFNQGMAHELLSLQILTVLLDGDPTEDSVDVAVGYMCVVGRALMEVSPTGVHAVMERFRGLLHEGTVGRRAQYRIESLLKIKKQGFRDYPTIPDEEHLDLVERDDQITFEIGLDDEGLKKEESLDVFKYDPEFDEGEKEWGRIRAEILGEDSSDEDSGSGSGSEDGSDSEAEDVPDQVLDVGDNEKKTVVIQDLTETDLVHLRRTIYLTIMSSATFEECTHKLAKMDIPEGRESELINMIIECCSQERTFLRYYGLVSGRFCLLNERWQQAFEEAFATQYNTIHRLETNKLRNVAKLFGHLLHTDSIPWSVLSVIHLNEDETTSSSRIFIKILIQEMAEAMGMVTLKERFDTDNPDPDASMIAGEDSGLALAATDEKTHPSTREWFKGMFPKDNPRNTRYAINFFTSIGLGPLTDGMREFLKNAPKLILAQAQAMAAKEAQSKNDDDDCSVLSTSSSSTSSFDSSSSSSVSSRSRSSYTSSSSYSSYSSDSRYRKRGVRRNRGGRRRGGSSRSYSSSSYDSDSSSSSREHRRSKRGVRTYMKSRDRSPSRDSASISDRSIDRKGGSAKQSKGKEGRDRRKNSSPSPNDSRNKSENKESRSSRRSVSVSSADERRNIHSPKDSQRSRNGNKNDRRRSTSSSLGREQIRGSKEKHRQRSHSNDRSRSSRKSSSSRHERNQRYRKDREQPRGRNKRERSSSHSSRSRSMSRSRSRSPPERDHEDNEVARKYKDEGSRKRSRRSRRSNSRSNSADRSR